MSSAAEQRPPLTRRGIVEAALGLVDREGLAALSMRRLAAELGVEAMSLYHHLPGKEAILDGIVEAVLGEMEPPAEGPWEEVARQMARSFRRVAHRHPHVFPLFATRPLRTSGSLRPVEAAMATLRRAGFPPDKTLHAFHAMVSYVLGFGLLELSGIHGPDPGLDLDTLPADRFPTLRALGQRLRACDPDREFEAGLDILVRGLGPPGPDESP